MTTIDSGTCIACKRAEVMRVKDVPALTCSAPECIERLAAYFRPRCRANELLLAEYDRERFAAKFRRVPTGESERPWDEPYEERGQGTHVPGRRGPLAIAVTARNTA